MHPEETGGSSSLGRVCSRGVQSGGAAVPKRTKEAPDPAERGSSSHVRQREKVPSIGGAGGGYLLSGEAPPPLLLLLAIGGVLLAARARNASCPGSNGGEKHDGRRAQAVWQAKAMVGS